MRAAVVGAGASGLTAVKELAQAGVDVACFDKGDRVGGIWAYENASGMSGAYRTLHLNTSKARTEFEDLPMPDEWPDYPSHEHMARYFEDYVDAFGVRDRIRLNTGVERAARVAGGGWELELDDGSRESFDVLVVASGHNWQPRWPSPAYPGEFHGEQVHAHAFRENGIFAGKSVLVVGMGNSAMDITVEASHVARATYLSTRRGSRIVPKYLFGKPADQITSPLLARMPWKLRQPMTHLLLRIAVGDPQKYGLPAPASGFLQDHPTVSDTILSRITHGEVQPKARVQALEGDRVRFADGSSEEVDVIVWCTGYEVTLPFIDRQLLGDEPGRVPLYMRVFHLDLEDLLFIGLMQSTGSALPIVEQQSKLVAEYLTGRYAPPPKRVQRKDVERRLQKAIERYGPEKRPAMRVDFDGYMRDLRRERERGAKRASEPVAA